jgi:tRNA G37 N-methylase TrmD
LYEELKGQGLQLIFVLGEDPQGNPPTPSYCQQWKQSHGVSAPILLDGHWAGLDSRITPSGYDLPWDYLLDGDNMMYVWESVEFSSEDLMNNIQTLLAD